MDAQEHRLTRFYSLDRIMSASQHDGCSCFLEFVLGTLRLSGSKRDASVLRLSLPKSHFPNAEIFVGEGHGSLRQVFAHIKVLSRAHHTTTSPLHPLANTSHKRQL
jgi:hypothetical protein